MKMTGRLLTFLGVLIFTLSSIAQTKDDAVNAYNRAVSLAESDLAGAVNAMKESAELADKAGPEADTIEMMAEKQIAALQYNYAASLHKERKIDEALDNFILAHEYAVQYNDTDTKAKTDQLLPKLYLSKGVNEYKNNQFNEAVASYSKAIEYDSTLARAYLNMGIAYKKMNQETEKQLALDQAIKHGLATNDEKTVEAARKTMSDDLLLSANAAFKKNDFNSTVSLLGEALQYNDSNPEIYYLQSVALNKLQKYDEALASAERGLALETDSAEQKARFNFELGNAYAGKGDTGNACAAYKKAAVGPFAESANYQIQTVLKCM